MLTEAIHTPFMMDRFLAVDNARYVMNYIDGFYDDIEFKQDGIVVTRAHQVLREAIEFMEHVEQTGMFDSIEKGLFAEVKRPKDGGKGFEGLVKKGPAYYNPFESGLKRELGLAR
jgi:beta-lysine 5,6-aminomutase alpha subunit